jgi:hypothetical protein
MYLSQISCHIGRLVVAAVLTAGTAGVVSAEHAGMTGSHDFQSMIPDDCRLAMHDPAHNGGQTPADVMQTFATELGLSGQQQQDLQILTADYGERLRDLAKLMRDSAEKLTKTEPGDPDYWPLAQEVSASAASTSAETVILISEMREKLHAVLTADQRAELKRRIEERKAQCKPQADNGQPAG